MTRPLLLPLFVLAIHIGTIEPVPAAPKQGTALLKTDILAVFAHPDDETGMAGTLAHYALGEGKVVVNVYCTRGEGGGNMVGTQWGPSLGILRETELRDCLEILGVRSCYFLDRLDWAYTESASATLRKWDRETTLEGLVRLVRALQPEVIVTMNPAPRPGQHGHHQAIGRLATEAFSVAADPNRFPSQLNREGLTVWQSRRLFYTGANDGNGVISTIALDQPLPHGVTPGVVAAKALANHRSQGFGNFANSPFMQRPQRFTLIKTLVPIEGVETNLLAGIPVPDATRLQAIRFAQTPPAPKIELEFISRPAFEVYREWVKEQQIEHVAIRFGADLPLIAGEPNTVQLKLRNNSPTPAEGELELVAPQGWTVEPPRQTVRAGAQSGITLEFRVAPPDRQTAPTTIPARFVANGLSFESEATIHPVPRINAARLTTSPALDGTELGWEGVTAVSIAPEQLVQGKVENEADSSAAFRLAHAGGTMFVDVEVKDDAIVANIEPNDIRGHWRSDSVELCFDPKDGAEDTLGCFKLGIFPFDATGVVQAARDADANQGPVEETAPRTRLFSRRTASGYRIQVAIPFSEIGLAPNQKRFGFNVILYDGDKSDAAPGENINKSRLAWAPRSGVQGRPEDWGRVDLQ